jgi:hypothetical protein
MNVDHFLFSSPFSKIKKTQAPLARFAQRGFCSKKQTTKKGNLMKHFCKMALGLLFITSAAHAASYNCGGVTLEVKAGSVEISGEINATGPITKYKPLAKNAGSTRYDISSSCDSSGSIYAILDKDLSAGAARGNLTLESTCDGDGSGPIFQRYSCIAK